LAPKGINWCVVRARGEIWLDGNVSDGRKKKTDRVRNRPPLNDWRNVVLAPVEKRKRGTPYL